MAEPAQQKSEHGKIRPDGMSYLISSAYFALLVFSHQCPGFGAILLFYFGILF